MAYSELIKNFERIRAYMREFYVYGFKNRNEYDDKSARSYDNERRRVESWLGKYMDFRQDENGRQVFLSVDSRAISHNPLYTAFRTKSFTDRDIVLHFCLLDMLRDHPMTVRECAESFSRDYLTGDTDFEIPDDSTIRKKLKENEELGLLKSEKQGKELVFSINTSNVDVEKWTDALDFFSEVAPLGVVGSYFERGTPSVFGYKHRYLLDALDSEILLELLEAVKAKQAIDLTIFSRRKKMELKHTVLPIRFYFSTQTGRQYILVYHYKFKKPMFFRLDGIRKLTKGSLETNYPKYAGFVDLFDKTLWGVSTGTDHSLDHIEIDIHVEPYEGYIVDRLNREKRHGTVYQADAKTWRFTADVYDASEMLPWIRTFIGRIDRIACTNDYVMKTFNDDLAALKAMYGGETDAVQ